MVKAYVLTEGEYSDYHIVGVYSTKENAEAVKRWIVAEDDDSYIASLIDIEEYELDPGVDAIRQGLNAYRTQMSWDGTTDGVYRVDADYDRESFIGSKIEANWWGVSGQVFARDEQHAVKIVNEKRAQMIAAGMLPQRN